jgi:hypothetical protein
MPRTKKRRKTGELLKLYPKVQRLIEQGWTQKDALKKYGVVGSSYHNWVKNRKESPVLDDEQDESVESVPYNGEVLEMYKLRIRKQAEVITGLIRMIGTLSGD